MKKLIVLIASFCLVSCLAIFSSQFFIDYNTVYANYFNTLHIKPQTNNFRIIKFPIPHLVIDSIQLEDGINLNSINISLSISSLIKLRPQIKSLTIGSIQLKQNGSEHSTINYEILLKNILKNKLHLQSDLQINHLIVRDNNNNIILDLNDVKSTYDSNTISFSASCNRIGQLSGTIATPKNGVGEIQLNMQYPYYDLTFSGTYKNTELLSGTGKYGIKNFARVISSSFPEMQSIFNKLNSDEQIDIGFELDKSQNQLQLKNILVSSKSIKGQGAYNIDANTFVFNFSTFNIDDLFSPNNHNTIITDVTLERTNSLLSINKLLQANIAVEALTIGGDVYNNVKFSSVPDNDKLYIKDFSGHSQTGEFQISGVISQNSYRSIFDGKIYIKHHNLNSILNTIGCDQATVAKPIPFAFESNIKSTLINLNMQNVSIKTDNANINGSISFKFIGSTPRINSRMSISSIDLTKPDYPIISPLWNTLTGFVTNMKDKAYLDKFIAIRTIPYVGSFDITLNDLFIDKTYLGKVILVANLSPEIVQINNLSINNGKDSITANIDLITNMLNPSVKITIHDGSLHTNFLTPKAILDFRNQTLQNFDVSKIYLKLQCSLSNVMQGDLGIKNLKFTAENENTLLKISDLSAEVLGGNLEASGSVLLSPYTINIVYALNSIDLNSLSSILPSGFLNTQGLASINGMISTNGDSIEKQLYNLYVKSALLAKDITINHFSLDDLIDIVRDPNYNLQNFDDVVKNALLTGKTAVSKISADIALIKGILSLKNIKLQTQYTTAAAEANVNIYNFGINLASIFSFYMLNKNTINNYNNNYTIIKFGLNIEGTLFSPQKTADSKELLQYLQSTVNKTN